MNLCPFMEVCSDDKSTKQINLSHKTLRKLQKQLTGFKFSDSKIENLEGFI